MSCIWLKRMWCRDKPALLSDGERQAILFNLACCYSNLGDTGQGLEALAGCLEAGYKDVNQCRTDPDLEALRQDPRFEGLIERLRPETKGPFRQFLAGFNL